MIEVTALRSRHARVASARHLAGGLLCVALVAGCGNGGNNQQPNAAVNPPTPVPVPRVTSTGANATLALNRVVEGLRTHGLDAEITDIRVFTTQTDPTHQLGRPGGYVARAAFTDTMLPRTATRQGSFARGATLELFPSGAAARASAGRAPDQLPGEKDLISGAVLLRLSPAAPHTLEDTYRTALRATTGTPPEVVA